MKFPPPPPYVFLEDSLTRSGSKAGLLFQDPGEVIECTEPGKVLETLDLIETRQKQGHFLAGWISYEAGYAFHPTLKVVKAPLSAEPLIWMGVFGKPRSFSAGELPGLFNKSRRSQPRAGLGLSPEPEENENQFFKAFRTIQDLIRAGDVYQVNHTFRLSLETFGPGPGLYARFRASQPAPFSALIETGTWQILSFSPELFVTRRGRTLISRPMKGTARPGVNLTETRDRMAALAGDEKNRAENLMITDLIRNDLSRVSEPGSVRTPKLFEVERFQTILQMSSEIHGTLKKGVEFREIFEALFPCGSVTGAPKVRAMEIIRETEKSPRGLYTGALGFMTPEGDFTFSVPIRTAVLDKKGQGWFGIGSGLVAQSKAGGEYAECRLKARFLEKEPEEFALIETLLWTPAGGYHFLKEHLERLKSSADYFGFSCDPEAVKTALEKTVGQKGNKQPQKVRLTLSKAGSFTIETRPFSKPDNKKVQKAALSPEAVLSSNVFLHHKTTRREVYDREFARARKTGLRDVIFVNEHGNITEGAIHNIFVQGNRGELFTPSLESGLLPGILRAHLLKTGGFKETSLTCDDLKKAQKTWLGNSVSGLVEVALVDCPKTNSQNRRKP